LSKALRHQGQSPEAITLDGYAASHRAVREMKADALLPEDTKVWSSKYLNNVIEQDHRHIKSRTSMMPGFKRFRSAATTISGIELTHRIRKGQFDLAKLDVKDAAAPAYGMRCCSIDKVSLIYETSGPAFLFAPEPSELGTGCREAVMSS
jgi:transposase-like protein